ncbi:MAG: hypothetical protein NT004_11530 [Bacteroidetes bacterium]|nr:hypothetical protein [Bacteroidota bacterium]
MKTLFTILLLAGFLSPAFSQKVISAKSQPSKLDVHQAYKRGLPPNLHAVLSFENYN